MGQIYHENISLNQRLSQLGIHVEALKNEKSKIMEDYTSKIEELKRDVVQRTKIDFILPYSPKDLANDSRKN